METHNRRKGSTWAKRLVNSIYRLSRRMWDHRNSTLSKRRTDTVSQKRRATILEQVDTELAIGHRGIRLKDSSNTTCFDGDKVRSWTTPAMEMLLKHVQTTRQRSAENKANLNDDLMDQHPKLTQHTKKTKTRIEPILHTAFHKLADEIPLRNTDNTLTFNRGVR